MYQGKFDNNENVPSNEEYLFNQPPQDPVAPVQNTSNANRSGNKKPITKGAKIFYISLLAFVFVAFLAVAIFLGILKDWLIRRENAEPTNQSNAVFQQYFANNPDWVKLYRAAQIQSTPFENADTFAAYMKARIGNQKLSFIADSNGLSDNRKYVVKAGEDDKIAVFILEPYTTADGDKEWKLSEIELLYQRNVACSILTDPRNTVSINGVTLDDSYVIKTVATTAEKYLPEGVHGYRTSLYRIEDLLITPTVTVTTPEGESVDMKYDEELGLFYHDAKSDVITDTETQTLTNAAQTYCRYMIGKATKTALKGVFDPTKSVFATITGIDKWMQSYSGYNFGEATISGYYRYNDDLYSARVSMTLFVTRKDGTVKEYPLDSTFLVEKQFDQETQSYNWMVIHMLNLDLQEQQVSVRLNFMENGKMIFTQMVNANAKSLTVPMVETPEGKQLVWSKKGIGENGKPAYIAVFQPDANGKAAWLGTTPMEPMTLYARFTAKEAE